MSLVTSSYRTSDARVLSHPALQRRSALRDRRPYAVRRHTGRVATRFAVLVLGDILAILFCRAIALSLAATTDGAIAYSGTPLLEGGSRFVFVGLIVLVAIFATGGHSRHRALYLPIRLFIAV